MPLRKMMPDHLCRMAEICLPKLLALDSFSHSFFVLSTSLTNGMSMLLLLLLVLFFIVSFFLAGSRVAFFSITEKELRLLNRKRRPSFRRIIHLTEEPRLLLTTLQIGTLFSHLAFIMISGLLLQYHLLYQNESLPLWLKIGAVGIVLILFAELLPKVWATHHRIWFAASASWLVDTCFSLFYNPARRLITWGDKIQQTVLPVQTEYDEEGLDQAIENMPESDATLEEKRILKSIRKFGDITAKQVMRSRLDVSSANIDWSFKQLLAKSAEFHYSRLPVCKGNLDRIAGIIHVKDLLPYLEEPDSFDWHFLIRPAFFVHEYKPIEDLLQELRVRRVHFAVVVDEFGGTSGILTLEDIMEEITGDIKDEFDEEENTVQRLDEYTYVFEGKTMINDACARMEISPGVFDKIRGDSDSLAGLLLEISGAFPQINEMVEWKGFQFTPLEIARNRIEKIKIQLPRTPNENA